MSSVSGSMTTLGHLFINGSRSLSPHFEFREKMILHLLPKLSDRGSRALGSLIFRLSLLARSTFEQQNSAERLIFFSIRNYDAKTLRGRTNQNETWCSQVFAVFFSSFILSRTDHVPVRDKIKLEKHRPPKPARLSKMTSIAAVEVHKLCTDFDDCAKSYSTGTVDDLEMAKSLSHRSLKTIIFLV